MFISSEIMFVYKIIFLDYGVLYNNHSDWLIFIAVLPVYKGNYLKDSHSLNRFRERKIVHVVVKILTHLPLFAKCFYFIFN